MTKNEPKTADEARNGFTAKTLTNSQFDEAWAIAEVMQRSINKTGSFIEKLADYSHAYARSEKFGQLKGEEIIRDVFKDRYGQSLNQMREQLLAREANLPEAAGPAALEKARRIETMISEGETQPFYRAYDTAAVGVAENLGITETGAKELMKSAYSQAEGRDLYETGKALEKAHHAPAREAAKQSRMAARSQSPARTRT